MGAPTNQDNVEGLVHGFTEAQWTEALTEFKNHLNDDGLDGTAVVGPNGETRQDVVNAVEQKTEFGADCVEAYLASKLLEGLFSAAGL